MSSGLGGVKVDRVVVEGCGRYGIYVGASDSWITDCTIARTGDAGIICCGSTQINHAHIWGCLVGVQPRITKYPSSKVWVCDSFIEANKHEGVKLGPYSVRGWVIQGNVFWQNSLEKPGTWSDISAVVEKPYSVTGVIINGNYFLDGKKGKYRSLHNICLGPESRNNTVVNNVFSSPCEEGPVQEPGGSNRFAGNQGYTTENTGKAVLPSGQTSVKVPHGLAASPATVHLTPTSDTGGKRFWVGTKDADAFTIRIDSPAAAEMSFDWMATMAGKTLVDEPAPK